MIVSHLLFSTRLSFIRKLFGNTTQLSLRICSQSVHLPYRFSKMDTNGSKKEEPFRRLEVPVKGLCDRYEYSVIQLKNGLTALLISDVDNLITLNADEENSLSKEVQSDSEESGDESASSESDSEMEVDEEEGVKKSSDEKLAALSLSVGVGSFCDGKIPGLAHFLEHMVFMGSEKYPEENDFDAFLSTRGGSSNASTEYEYTTFYFEVPEPHLKSSMDIFSNFFISPLLRRDSIQNEMEIVDSEFQSSILNDTCRLEQLLATTCTAQNPAGKFVWGNMDTLGSAGVDEAELYAALQEFRRRYYVADRMTLALQARLDMATLESWVVEHFSGIPSSPSDLAEIPSTQPMPQSTQAKQGPRPTPRFTVETPFELDRWNRFYTVKPVDDINILYLTWFTPPVQDLYPIKPLDMLSWMIGHEGKGSIMSYLRQRHLATELEAGYQDSGFDYNHIYTLFQINVTLTDQGLTQIKHIIDIVFQYISLLNQSPITEAMYQEVAQIHRIGFDYSSTKSSSDYTEQLSQNMLYFPSGEYLTGPALYTRHSPSTIQAMLDCFTPARLNIALQSSIVCKRPDQVGVLDGIVSKRPGVENGGGVPGGLNLDQVEKWFQTEYRVDAIDESCLREWTNVRTTDPALFLPARNQFVATSFDLYPIGNETTESSKYPEPLLKTDQMELWFKQTIKYKLPKTNVYFVLEMPHVKESAQTSVLLDVYLCALNVILQEKTYDAYLAQYFVTVCRGEYGIHVSCNGFSQHMHQFVDIVLTHIKTVDVSRDLFNVCRETLLRQYINNLKDTEVLRRCLRMGILIKTSYMVEDKYRILRDDITYEQLMNFQSTLYDRMFVKCLVMGNITRESALSLSTLCTSRLPFTPLDPSERREIRVTELERCEKIVRVRSLNEKDPNCSVLNYYQSSQVQGTMRESCVIELLVEIVAEPLFDTLRTKMKLGYYVNATVRDTFGVLGISIVVDSQVHKYSVDDIQSKIHGFISRYVRDNEASIAEKYGAIVETVVKKKNMAEVNLKEESSRHFEEIKLNDYQFDRQEKEIELIKQIPLSEVRDWIDNNIVNQGRKLLSIQVVGDGDGTNDAAVSKETEQQAMSTTTTTTTEKIAFKNRSFFFEEA
uniref:Nardilysin n=1 Tax=Cacopsylla melanoneura TaxID=428564 RepID=A0A8D8W199_9HEMI